MMNHFNENIDSNFYCPDLRAIEGFNQIELGVVFFGCMFVIAITYLIATLNRE